MSAITTRDAYERLDDLIGEWSRVAYDYSQSDERRVRREMARIGAQVAEALIEAPGAMAYIKRRAGRTRGPV